VEVASQNLCVTGAIELFTVNPVRESQGRSKTWFLEKIFAVAVKLIEKPRFFVRSASGVIVTRLA
jgi:hypothetical protein